MLRPRSRSKAWSAPRGPAWTALWLGVTWLVALAASGALARPSTVDVATELRGEPLGTHLEVLRDRSHALTFADVITGEHAQRFAAAEGDTLNVGFTRSAFWFRFDVENTGSRARSWLLELAFPLIDDVTLYIPRARGGYSVRRTGDMLPFDTRDISFRNVVFALEEPAHARATYYMRVSSTSSLQVPLLAWSFKAFLEHKHVDWAALCIFYGVLLAMSCYTALVFFFTKQREYVACTGYIVCTGFFQFTAAGHTFQFLLPRDPWWTHHLGAASLCLAFGCAAWGMRACFSEGHPVVRPSGWIAHLFLALAATSFFVPYGPLVKYLTIGVVAVLFSVSAGAGWLAVRDSREARLFLLGWGAAIAGGMVAALFLLGALPQHFLTTWSLQIGVSLQLVMLSSALADKLNVARTELAVVHGALSDKFTALSQALSNARDATERAERATRLKDEFMATMSHELRTPLNPIINIPQGLYAEFKRERTSTCAHCGTAAPSNDNGLSACSACGHTQDFVHEEAVTFDGEALRARSLLTKVERSGRELLGVINGVLDFGKMQSGHLVLVRESSAADTLLDYVLRELRERAKSRQIAISCSFSEPALTLSGDTLRLRQLLFQLVDNAIKFSRPGGSVSIRVTAHSEHVELAVEDRGIGIAPEHFEKIFESFEQIDKGNTRRYGGIGLGLAIARALARLHGGDITVASELGRGSCFTLTLPRRTRTLRAS